MNVFLIRHGQTDLNNTRVHQSSLTPLSKQGLSESLALAKKLKEKEFEVILSSPYLRACQTAELISKHTSKKLVILDELKEIKSPSVIQGKSHFDPEVKKIEKNIKDRVMDREWHHSDEENYWDFRERVANFSKNLALRNEENILIVTHGYFLSMFVSICLLGGNLDPDAFSTIKEKFVFDNTGITHTQLSAGKWQILKLNETSHLYTH